MRFQEPIFLLALLLVPLAALAYQGSERRRRSAAAAFGSPRTIPSAMPTRPGWRRHVAPAAYAAALAVLAFALARPEATIAVPDKRSAVMLVTDVSGSMRQSDIQPTRLGAARRATRAFLDDVPEDVRVGAVAFNHTIRRAEAPTTDRAPIRELFDQVEPAGGTAVGEGLAAGLRLVRSGVRKGEKPPPAAIVLITDGESDAGRSPVDAAREAARAKVRVYTVALGGPRGAQTLRRVADLTGGRTFEAGDDDRLRDVYRSLSEEVGRRKERREVTAAFAGGAALLLLLGGAASLLWFGRLP